MCHNGIEVKKYMENSLRLILFQIIYDELNLLKYENKLQELGVKHKKIVGDIPPVSQYFFLKNSVHLENLTEEENSFLQQHMNQDFDSLKEDKILLDFLKRNKLRLLIPKTQEKVIMWKQDNPFYMTPANSIVIAFHFIEFDDSYTKEVDIQVVNMLNEIQALSHSVGYIVSILSYNEVPTQARIL